MKKIAIALGAIALCSTATIAQNAAPPAPSATQASGPDSAAGRALWEGAATQCKNCHGRLGEGGFGPDLAGRGLSPAEFTQAVRHPWGVMPAFVDTQVSDTDLVNMAAYFAALPKVAALGAWRMPVVETTAHGQQVAAAVGCAQCHGATLDNVRGLLGGTNADFDLFKSLVYTHTTAMPQVDAMLNPPNPAAPPPGGGRGPQRLRMGNFNAMRVSEGQLKDIYDWVKEEVGFRPSLQARLVADPSGAPTYTINLSNNGLKDKGLTVQGLVIDMTVPAGISVVSATGSGYKGVHHDAQANADVAEWQIAKLAPKDTQSLTLTLSKAPANVGDLKGTAHWSRPGPKKGPSTDVVNIGAGGPPGAPPGAPAGGRRGG